jgi:RNA polymerase sigma-70 factor, ECF subfamily
VEKHTTDANKILTCAIFLVGDNTLDLLDGQIERLRKGDADACERFVREHALKLYGWLYHLTGRREEAEDLAQEALSAFWESIQHKKPPVAARVWLFSIARNIWRQHCRRSSSRPQPESHTLETVTAPGQSALETLEYNEVAHALETAVAELNDEFREVFSLRAWHSMEYAEIAAIQGVSPDLVRWRFFRARQQLRTRLGHWFDRCEKNYE